MKPEEQRIAIAKYLAEIEGFYRLANGGTAETVPLQYLEPGSDGGLFLDYCGDLNAMHVAEKVLFEMDKTHPLDGTGVTGFEFPSLKYGRLLIEATQKTNPFHTSAPQRAETFIRTINKWTDQ